MQCDTTVVGLAAQPDRVESFINTYNIIYTWTSGATRANVRREMTRKDDREIGLVRTVATAAAEGVDRGLTLVRARSREGPSPSGAYMTLGRQTGLPARPWTLSASPPTRRARRVASFVIHNCGLVQEVM